MIDFTHLNALEECLFNETKRLNAATKPSEIAMRNHIVAMCKKEIAGERAFLKLPTAVDIRAINDDDLLSELMG